MLMPPPALDAASLRVAAQCSTPWYHAASVDMLAPAIRETLGLAVSKHFAVWLCSVKTAAPAP